MNDFKKRAIFIIAILLVCLLWPSPHPQAQGTRITFDTGQVSCAGTVTSLLTANPQRTGLLITNVGTVAVYIGNSAVTTGTGAYLPGGASISIPTRDAVSCISSGASQTVSFLETYQSF